MTTIAGQLVSPDEENFTGYRVRASFSRTVTVPAGDAAAAAAAGAEATTVTVADQVVGETSAKGAFRLTLPDDGIVPPIVVTALAPNGAIVGRASLAGSERRLRLTVEPAAPVTVTPSDDPRRGQEIRLIGRVLDQAGAAAPPGLVVVLLGQPAEEAEQSERPLLVAETTDNGYFFDQWPSDKLSSATARVLGAGAVPITLEDGRLPKRLIIVLPELPSPPEGEPKDDDCECAPAPPRAPDPSDLGSSTAFSGDGGTCVDLTIPNRTIEEVTYHALVRTTEPEIKGLTLPDPDPVPGKLLDRLANLVQAREQIVARAMTPSAELRPSASAARMVRAEPRGGITEVLASGTEAAVPALRLTREHALTLVGTRGDIDTAELQRIDLASRFSTTKSKLDLLDRGHTAPGRLELGPKTQIDWDETPTLYQATTIAHGHLLTFRQVWRADGYSLGDLLYSLPLAPGQIKQIAIVEWDREETARRDATRLATEALTADLVHDRDISEIISSALSEQIRARSSADTEAAGGGLGGFIGPVIFGIGGGVGSAGSTASQDSHRQVSGTMFNRARDRTTQASSAVRSQRATVVQTARQGESVRAQTEVVANYNHCHSVTIEYFEVLRHFLVSDALVAVQECLFIPFELSPFTAAKAFRWRDPLTRFLRDRRLAGGFDALDRVRTSWSTAHFPVARYADDPITDVDAELWLTISVPRPPDDDNGGFVQDNWTAYEPLLSDTARNVFDRNLDTVPRASRTEAWDRRVAPGLVDRLINRFRVDLLNASVGSLGSTAVDATLVSTFGQERPMLVTLRLTGTLGARRADVAAFRISLPVALPAAIQIVIRSGSARYRTDHLHHTLFRDYRVDNDLGTGDDVTIPTPIDSVERRNPRAEDQRIVDQLVDHLNDHLEYYHQGIWLVMDPNRRFVLLDGFLAPNAGGRSVASVVENRILGVIGNCLVMPLVPGVALDPTYALATRSTAELIDLYAADPAVPYRISVPTKGVFAEAVIGACNSCERKDDKKYWHWSDAPIPDSPTAITPVSTGTRRRTPPALAPDTLPDAIVGFQNVPTAPAPSGLQAALNLIGTPNLFRDLMQIAGNQANASEALSSSLAAAQQFGLAGADLAQQRFANQEMDRTLERIKKARDAKIITPQQAQELTSNAFRKAVGAPPPASKPTQQAAVGRVIDRVAASESGTLRVENAQGTVEVRKGADAAGGRLDTAVTPKVIPLAQESRLTCWAAAGAMMMSWKNKVSISIEAAADRLGGEWRRRLDQKTPLSVNEIQAYTRALELKAEAPQSLLPQGLARLLRTAGPIWVIGDDTIEDNHLVHVRIATGIRGDGSNAATFVALVDPDGGRELEEKWTDFVRRLEARDVIATGLGMYHY